MAEEISGFGSGYPNVDVDLGPMARLKTGVINKSPVLYLRRRRNTDLARHHYAAKASPKGFSITALGRVEEKFSPVDKGAIYPNHFGIGRISNIEWTMYRDYMHRKPKWVKSVELVIDGKCNTSIT